MNNLQLLIISVPILLIGLAIHIAFFLPPLWVVFLAGICGGLYYSGRVWFMLRIPGDLVIFAFEAIIATVVAYGLLIGVLLML